MSADPFHDPEQTEPRVKALIYGPSGVGKTYLALTAPGPIAVIDTEGGTAFYADRVGPKGLSPFRVLPTKTFAQVEQAVGFLRGNPGAYRTLVIDPVTVLYEVLQEAAQKRRADIRRNADADLEMLDWSRIKSAYKRLMNDLVNLDLHVIVTAREADLREERVGQNGRKELVKIGVRPEAEKSTPYYFDTVLRLQPMRGGREAVVEKDRTGVLDLGAAVANPSFDALFSEAIARGGTAKRAVPSDDDAASADARITLSGSDRRPEPTLVPLGRETHTGKVTKGGASEPGVNDLLYTEAAHGHRIGFRLDLGGGKALPQVICDGAIGEALFVTVPVEELLDATVTVEGEAYRVETPGRRAYRRLMVTRITGPDFAIPATDPVPAATEDTSDLDGLDF